MRRFHLILALTFSLFCMATPDFRYPKTVARQAEQDLETALKQRDADRTVDALTRYCLAQSIISRENAADIINRVEQVRRSEPRADLHAMLGVLEMHLYRQLANELWWDIADRNNPTDSLPADVFEWDRVQFENKIRTLFEESTADADLLAQIPLERYPQSVLTDEKSIPYLPNVFDFVMSEANELLSLTQEDVQKWHRIHAADTLASYFLQANYPVSNMAKLPEHEAEALIWKNKLVSDSDYTALQSYARQHTGSRFLPTIRNLIRRIEAKHVTTTLPPEAGRFESINIAMDIRNVQQGQILIYRIDDETNLSKLQPVRSTAFHVDAQIPFDTTIQMRLDGLDYGRYAIVPAYEADGRMHRPRRVYTHECIQVTDMKTFCTSVENGESYFFVVDAQTGSPLKNVSVYSTQNNKSALIGHTDLQGSVRYRTEYGNYYARQGRDQTCTQYVFREQIADRAAQRHLHASLLTDLGIYRPGETVRMTLIAYYSTITRRDAAGQETFEVVMRDANYQPIDTLVMHTDDWGQATAEAVIPTDRLNGRYQLSIKHMPRDSKQTKEPVGAAYFEVSEYKAHTFFIEFNSTQTTYNRNEPVNISGQVMTYSGLPLANTAVTLQLSRSQWAWRYHLQDREQLTDTIIQTNQEGRFDITLPSALFRQDDTDGQTYRSFRTYYLTARATSPAGESQETSHSFYIGRLREICYNGSTDFINEGSICLPVSMRSSDPADTTATIRYSLALMSDTTHIVRQGVLHLPDTRIATRELPSGHYLLRVTCADNDATIPLRQSVVIFRTTDSRCPVDSALWIPQGGCKAEQGKANIIIGCGTDEAHIRYVAYSRTKTLKEGWLHYAKGLHTLQLDMPQGTDEELNLLFVCVSHRQVLTKTIRLRSPEQDSINISIERFQDKAMAGQPVEWTIRVRDAGKRPAHARLVLELYSKALNDLADNTWDFSPDYASPIQANTHFNRLSRCRISTAYHQPEEKEFDIRPPHLNCYNQAFFASWGTAAANGRIIMRKTASFARAGIAEDNQVAFAVMKESADAELGMNDRTGLGETPNPDKISIREGEEKTVVWKPRLETDSDGSVVLRFDAPESAGRWILQTIAYNENMTAAGLHRELLTQRPLMTQLQLPRFVRQSDLAMLSALIQNAADQPQQVTTYLEVIDARTQKTLHAEQQNLIVPASGSKAVTLSINIPDTLSSLIVRVRASSGHFSDGEQQQICVLPNTTPVTESRPFFIRTDEEQCVLDLEAAERATSTIEVCANPVWLCVLALPGITGEHTPTATGIAHRLYATAVARNIVEQRSDIRQAISDFKQQHAAQQIGLKSAAPRIEGLTLAMTPWISAAKQQEQRMEQLVELTDERKNKLSVDQLVGQLQQLQTTDGGLRWFDCRQSNPSVWATTEVLQLIGELRQKHLLQEHAGLNRLTERALTYLDNEAVKQLRLALKNGKQQPDYLQFAPYAYTRSLFTGQKASDQAAAIIRETLKALSARWGELGLMERAYAAATLQHNRQTDAAAQICHSLLEHAMSDRQQGMWWDGLQDGGYARYSRVGLTAQVLRTLHLIGADAPLDEIRQWLLLQKQTNDWGNSSMAADVIDALITTGSIWSGTNSVQINVDGKPLRPDTLMHLGYGLQRISPDARRIEIVRHGDSPAWGAVYRQYTAGMSQSLPAATDELQISKDYYVYGQKNKLVHTNRLHVGDKVQVRLVITCRRDMQYVSIVDDRAACFEPVDQASGSALQDGLWLYRDTRDAQTDIHLYALSKGTHVITYDVNVTRTGTYNSGIATIQSQYAPMQAAHTGGSLLLVAP